MKYLITFILMITSSLSMASNKEALINMITTEIDRIETMNDYEFREFYSKRIQRNKELVMSKIKDKESYSKINFDLDKEDVLFMLEKELYRVQSAKNYMFTFSKEMIFQPAMSNSDAMAIILLFHFLPPLCWFIYGIDIVTLPITLFMSFMTGF